MSASAHTALRAHVRDAAWKRATEAGNAAFASGDAVNALLHYEAALVEAEGLFAAELRDAPSGTSLGPMLWAISTQNLAELTKHSDRARASAMFQAAVERLIALTDDPELPLPVRHCAARQLRPAIAEVLADATASQRDPNEHAASLVARAQAAAFRIHEILSNDS